MLKRTFWANFWGLSQCLILLLGFLAFSRLSLVLQGVGCGYSWKALCVFCQINSHGSIILFLLFWKLIEESELVFFFFILYIWVYLIILFKVYSHLNAKNVWWSKGQSLYFGLFSGEHSGKKPHFKYKYGETASRYNPMREVQDCLVFFQRAVWGMSSRISSSWRIRRVIQTKSVIIQKTPETWFNLQFNLPSTSCLICSLHILHLINIS